jgi:uncharacterized protein (TIGR02453 family)
METFRGFSPEALKFLRDLAKHNDRAWFTPRKEIYQTELLVPLQALVADATTALYRAKVPLGGDPKRSTFRIYRDIRFSSDKSPYKTNVGAFLRREDTPDVPGGLYIHIQPKQSFMAAGFYQIDGAMLQRWREAMALDPKGFETMIRTLERGKLKLSEQDDPLKRMPRGFEALADHSIGTFFRLRSFITSETLSDDDVMDAGLVERVVSLAKRAKPLLVYGWAAILP